MQHIERGSWLMEKIAELQRDCDKVEVALSEAKKLAKLLAKDLKAKQTALHRAVRASYEETPLFDGVEANTTTGSPDICEEWRDSRLDTLGLSNSILENLANAGITTMGQLADYSGQHSVEDIHGIGPAADEEIANACARFWQLWNERTNRELDTAAETVVGGEQVGSTEPAGPGVPGDGCAAVEPQVGQDCGPGASNNGQGQ